jgi:hypothetical protein
MCASCASCAVFDYFATGSAGGYSADSLAFQRVLCDANRSRLEGQADRIAADVQAATAGIEYGLLHTDSTDEQTTSRNGVTIDAHTWTFTLIDRDGWQVCTVATPWARIRQNQP